MTLGDIRSIVLKTVAQDSGRPPEEIRFSDDLLDDLLMASLAIYEVIVDLEAAFDLQINDEEVDKLRTLDDIVDYVDKRMNQ